MEELIVSILFFLVEINILKTERIKLDINPIAPVYWVDSESIFVNEQKRSYRYDVVNREVLDEYEREENQLWGYCKEGVFLCGWENRDISSPDEYSTHLRVDDSNGESILDVELKPTVEVVECSDIPLLKTIFPIEERYFSFKDELYEVESYEMDMLSPNLRRLLSRDSLGNYWITEFRIN
jgi:hypothetical protein